MWTMDSLLNLTCVITDILQLICPKDILLSMTRNFTIAILLL